MRNPYRYEVDSLFGEEVRLADVAEVVGTPCYVYSQAAILERYRQYDESLAGVPHTICYAVKANANVTILKRLAEAGAGFDIVSGGELYRVLQAGGDPAKVVFSGVGKRPDEIEFALRSGIHSFNCESAGELDVISAIAVRLGRTVRIALRVNPDVNAATHPYISTGLKEHKFGVDMADAPTVYARGMALPNLVMEGVSCHIGSQLMDSRPLTEAVQKVLALIEQLRAQGVPLTHLDVGGGLGVPYRSSEIAPDVIAYGAALRGLSAGRNLHLLLEPGRSIVGEAGALLTRVLYRKTTGSKEFVVVDAAMNDLIRPALYQAHHELLPLERATRPTRRVDVVGPVCESGDFLAKDRELPTVHPGELLAIMTAGAYGFAQASNYNSRPRPAEVLLNGEEWSVIRERETYADLIRGE